MRFPLYVLPLATLMVTAVSCKLGTPEPYDAICEMENPGLPFSRVIFSPAKGEILYVMDTAVLRMPLKVTSEEAEKLTYDFVWTNEAGTQTYAGQVVREGETWEFITDGVKGGVCRPSGPVDHVYKTLEDLGVASGDYVYPQGGSKVKFPGNGNQQYMLDEGDGAAVYTYRVIEVPDGGGVLIAESATSLSDRQSTTMTINSLTPMGDTLVEVSFPGQPGEIRRSYVRPGSAAALAAPPPSPQEPELPELDPVSTNAVGVEWVVDGLVALSVAVDKVSCSSAAGSRYCDIIWTPQMGVSESVWAKVYDADGVKQKETVGIGSVEAQGITPGEKFKTRLIIESTTKRVEFGYR